MEVQSLSMSGVHPSGQQPSPETQVAMVVWVQAAVHLSLLPVSPSMVQALLSLQEAMVGHDDGGSHVSPGSRTLLPQTEGQSVSVFALQTAPSGQQPSPETQVAMVVWVQAAVHLALLPVSPSMVQALLSLQEAMVGHDDGGSQVSPGSTTLLPQTEGQSVSVFALQTAPAGQQPSPETQVAMVVWVQAALQLALLPVSPSMVQALPSLQEARVGHDDGGSQVSPVSTAPLPQVGEQSRSVLALHPTGQHLSVEAKLQPLLVWVHTTLHLALLPVI